MSIFQNNFVLQGQFTYLPSLGNNIPGEPQVQGSLDSRSASSHLSGSTLQHHFKLSEGDLITGTVDITHEHAHMLPVIQNTSCMEEKVAMVCVYLSLT